MTRRQIDRNLYGLYALFKTGFQGNTDVSRPIRKGAEEARNQLPTLLIAAERGRQTIITRHGRPVAVLAPFSAHGEGNQQRSLLPLSGTARGIYGRDGRTALRKLRDEWSR